MYSVRVANELGRGDANAVRFAINVILGTSIVIGVIVFILCLVFGSQLGYLFTKEAAVADAVSDLSVLLALSVLFNSIYPVFSGSHFIRVLAILPFLASFQDFIFFLVFWHQVWLLELACSLRLQSSTSFASTLLDCRSDLCLDMSLIFK